MDDEVTYHLRDQADYPHRAAALLQRFWTADVETISPDEAHEMGDELSAYLTGAEGRVCQRFFSAMTILVQQAVDGILKLMPERDREAVLHKDGVLAVAWNTSMPTSVKDEAMAMIVPLLRGDWDESLSRIAVTATMGVVNQEPRGIHEGLYDVVFCLIEMCHDLHRGEFTVDLVIDPEGDA